MPITVPSWTMVQLEAMCWFSWSDGGAGLERMTDELNEKLRQAAPDISEDVLFTPHRVALYAKLLDSKELERRSGVGRLCDRAPVVLSGEGSGSNAVPLSVLEVPLAVSWAVYRSLLRHYEQGRRITERMVRYLEIPTHQLVREYIAHQKQMGRSPYTMPIPAGFLFALFLYTRDTPHLFERLMALPPKMRVDTLGTIKAQLWGMVRVRGLEPVVQAILNRTGVDQPFHLIDSRSVGVEDE